MGSTPLTLRCSKCRKYRRWDSSKADYDKLSDKNLVATGGARKARRGTNRRRTLLLYELRLSLHGWRAEGIR